MSHVPGMTAASKISHSWVSHCWCQCTSLLHYTYLYLISLASYHSYNKFDLMHFICCHRISSLFVSSCYNHVISGVKVTHIKPGQCYTCLQGMGTISLCWLNASGTVCDKSCITDILIRFYE